MRIVLSLAVAFTLAGCAYQLQLMPRDSGTIYGGSIHGNLR